MRLIMIARNDVVAKMNEAAKLVDIIGGERTFTVPLARPNNPTVGVAFWCSWDIDATGHQLTSIRDRLREKGATQEEVTPIPVGQTPASQRFAIFRADQWTPEQVLSVLNLQPI